MDSGYRTVDIGQKIPRDSRHRRTMDTHGQWIQESQDRTVDTDGQWTLEGQWTQMDTEGQWTPKDSGH